jgi:Mrp family chromosome partitioning ATPase
MESKNNHSASKKTQLKKTDRNEVLIDQDLDLDQMFEWTKIDENIIENMRLMIARIQKGDEFPKRLSLFSALSGEGVTTMCLGLSIALANDYHKNVCLVDLNWYSPSSQLKNISGGLGIADYLEDKAPLDKVIRQMGNTCLYILPAGDIDDAKRPAIARGQGLSNLLDELDIRFDYLILDIPAILSTSAAVPLAGHSQAGCMVIQQGVTPMHDVKLALDEISHMSILGVIINRTNLKTPNSMVKYLAG